MNVTRDTIRLRSEFDTRKELVDYLLTLCEINLPRTLVTSRVARGWHPYEAITKRRIMKPASNHPFKRHYQQEITHD